ncbi:MAG: hypothetical protein GC152_04075 [Alphaproteobacteria bacterium]|nr:hypothetical protein [Alphaproteobacteria bacterium]
MTGVQVHAVALALAVDPDGPHIGVLALGGAGAGKSSLAIAAVHECPWRRTALVADDRVALRLDDRGELLASPPPALAGLVEVWGYGPLSVRSMPEIDVRLVLDLGGPFQRLPERRRWWPAELDPDRSDGIPCVPFDPRASGVVARARLVARSILVDKSTTRRTIG